MNARDSFDVPPPRQPGRVKRVDLFLSIVEDDEGNVNYIDTFQFHRPDEAGGEDYHAGPLRPQLTPTHKDHAKGLLDWALAKANGDD